MDLKETCEILNMRFDESKCGSILKIIRQAKRLSTESTIYHRESNEVLDSANSELKIETTLLFISMHELIK